MSRLPIHSVYAGGLASLSSALVIQSIPIASLAAATEKLESVTAHRLNCFLVAAAAASVIRRTSLLAEIFVTDHQVGQERKKASPFFHQQLVVVAESGELSRQLPLIGGTARAFW
jgi:hypothetical protein